MSSWFRKTFLRYHNIETIPYSKFFFQSNRMYTQLKDIKRCDVMLFGNQITFVILLVVSNSL